jgi:hypothetical protein
MPGKAAFGNSRRSLRRPIPGRVSGWPSAKASPHEYQSALHCSTISRKAFANPRLSPDTSASESESSKRICALSGSASATASKKRSVDRCIAAFASVICCAARCSSATKLSQDVPWPRAVCPPSPIPRNAAPNIIAVLHIITARFVIAVLLIEKIPARVCGCCRRPQPCAAMSSPADPLRGAAQIL